MRAKIASLVWKYSVVSGIALAFAPLGCASQSTASSSADVAETMGDAGAGADTAKEVLSGEPTCENCLFTQQPAAPHPGGLGSLALAPEQTISYGSEPYKQILVVRPEGAGPLPTVLFVAGKQLYQGGSPLKLGAPYRLFLEHIASHGYVAAFVRVEQNLLDGDHLRMADDLLTAATVLAAQVPQASPTLLAYVGHSMGAKVVLLAASKATAGDPTGKFPDPKAVLAFAVSNEPPPFGAFQDAVPEVAKIPADSATWFTLATGDDDTIAPWNDPQKANAQALYDALKTERRQLIVVDGTGPDDPNMATTPELVDDHSAPLSIEGKPGGAADFAMPISHLDALDWYGFWKWTVGALDFHFGNGSPAWAYGALRTHGGTSAQGQVILHQIVHQGWSMLPAKN